MTDILFTHDKHLGIITLNRPEALNALTLSMIRAMYTQLLDWQIDQDIHAVVIMAATGKAFCAGGDVRWLYEMGRRQDPQQMQFFKEEYALNQLIHDYNKPYIALMNGITMGGGVGISLHGSHAVASEHFVFAMPETSIGFFPDIGASFLLSHCPDAFGVYLGLTGERVNAVDAKTLELIHYVIAAEQFPLLLNVLGNIDLSQDANTRVSDCLMHFSAPIPMISAIENIQNAVNDCFQYDNMEAIMAALKTGHSAWHQKTYEHLLKKSPLSLKITLTQLRNVWQLPLNECLQLDLFLAEHFMQGSDFYEGVRALLVDKDKTPHWNPLTLNDVTQSQIDSYFFR